jgi:hypothetical protein
VLSFQPLIRGDNSVQPTFGRPASHPIDVANETLRRDRQFSLSGFDSVLHQVLSSGARDGLTNGNRSRWLIAVKCAAERLSRFHPTPPLAWPICGGSL